jgi:hypothetical protein
LAFATALCPLNPCREFAELSVESLVLVLKSGFGVDEGSLKMYEAVASRGLKAVFVRTRKVGVL